MSLGIGGTAKLALQDENTVIYEYAPYNLNDPAYRNADSIYDGIITIEKNALVEPEIHEKIKRMPGGRKKTIIKRIRVDVDYSNLLKSKKIKIENSRFCWHIMPNGHGRIALALISQIFSHYQEEGMIPKTISYNV